MMYTDMRKNTGLIILQITSSIIYYVRYIHIHITVCESQSQNQGHLTLLGKFTIFKLIICLQ